MLRAENNFPQNFQVPEDATAILIYISYTDATGRNNLKFQVMLRAHIYITLMLRAENNFPQEVISFLLNYTIVYAFIGYTLKYQEEGRIARTHTRITVIEML